jgi:hypothetical protein
MAMEVPMRFLMLFGLSGLALALTACGGTKEAFEKAEYLLAQGGGLNGLKASAMMEGRLTSGSLADQMKAHRYYGGGKINASGLDGARFIANLTHSEADNDTVSIFRSALDAVVPVFLNGALVTDASLEEQGLAAEEYLLEGISAFDSFRQTAAYQAVELGSSEYCARNQSLCRGKGSVELVYANLQFMRALNIGVRLSTFGISGNFNEPACINYFTSNSELPDSFASSLRLARISYALAGLDDSVFEGSDGAVDAQNALPNEFIEDIQGIVDSDRDGDIPGTAAQKAGVVCGYLETQDGD